MDDVEQIGMEIRNVVEESIESVGKKYEIEELATMQEENMLKIEDNFEEIK